MHLETGPPAVTRVGTKPELPISSPSVIGASVGPAGASRDALVTVLIPSRDRPELIRRSVASALAQEGVSLEVVVVDDGSAIPVSAVLSPDPRVRVLRSERSEGVASARNRGIEAAQTEWIAFLDDDDLWAPTKLAQQLEAARATGATWCHTGALRLNSALAVEKNWTIVQNQTGFELLLVANLVSTPSTVLISTEALRRAGGFDPAFSIMADWDLWLRLASECPAAVVPEPLVGYVIHEESMHRQHAADLRRELRLIKKKHKLDGPIRSPQTWRWIAQIHWETGQRLQAIPLGMTAALLYMRQPWFGGNGLVARAGRHLRRRIGNAVPAAFETPPWVLSPAPVGCTESAVGSD